jgi:hypothetical protein
MMGPVGYAVVVLVSGLAGAIVYLFIFNRATQQSMHDLVAGTYVTRTGSAGYPASFWRGHILILTGLLVLLVFGLVGLPRMLVADGQTQALTATVTEIEATGRFHTVRVSVNRSIASGDEEYLLITGVLKRPVSNPREVIGEMVGAVLTNYPEARSLDLIDASVTRGFDIGLASKWAKEGGRFTPARWEVELTNP